MIEITIPDERLGLPSASGIERIALCPGSWNLERTIPEGPRSEDAAFGTAVHALLAGETDWPEATPEVAEAASRCERALEEVASKLYGYVPDADDAWRERRLWMSDNGQRIFSGKADLVARFGSRWMIVDYKTGRNNTEPAARNHQLRALAVLLWDSLELPSNSEITALIVAPWQQPQVTACRYDADSIVLAREELLRILALAFEPDAPRRASEDACRYCRAKAVCPEAQAALNLPAVQQALEVTNDQLSQLLSRCALADDVIDAIRSEARSRLSQGVDVPGWRLKEVAPRETIVNLNEVCARLSRAHGVTVEQFSSACSLTKTALRDLLHDCGLKGRALDDAASAAIDGCVEKKTQAPRLEREKDRL